MCIHPAFCIENTSLIDFLWEIESIKLWKALPPWIRDTQAGPEINILKKWKKEDSHTCYDVFSTKVYLSFRRLQTTYPHIFLKMLPRGRKSRRSVFLPSLYCTNKWYFCHLCLLAKLSMKLICNTWLNFIQNWTVNLFYKKYLY